LSRLNGWVQFEETEMSRTLIVRSVAFAAAALLSLPAALAADYHLPDGVDVEVDTEIDVKGVGYSNHIDVHIDYEHESDAHIDHTKSIDVDVDDPVDVPSEVIDQVVVDEELQLNGMDYINTVTLHLDGDVVQGDPDGVNEEEGDYNVQENKDVVTPDPADSFLRQNLTNNSFNTDPADGANPVLRNTVDFSITSDGPITEDIAVNAAAGAFNLQANSMVVAVGMGLLGQSQADSRQDTVANGSVLQDATNEIFSTIDLENVAANVGINLVSGVGNAQINSFTATTSFGP
jgi:hypothetical protein